MCFGMLPPQKALKCLPCCVCRNMIICGAGLCQYLIDAYPEVRLMLVLARAYPVPDYAEHLDCQLVGPNLPCAAGLAPL